MGWTAGVRFLAEARFFCSPQRPDRLWGSPNLLSSRYGGGGALLPGVKPPEREVDHLRPSIAEVNGGVIPPLPSMSSFHCT
jgi:hypothetical protein